MRLILAFKRHLYEDAAIVVDARLRGRHFRLSNLPVRLIYG